MSTLARRRIPVADAAPVQLGLGLVWADPIRHRRRKATTYPAPIVAVAVRKTAAA